MALVLVSFSKIDDEVDFATAGFAFPRMRVKVRHRGHELAQVRKLDGPCIRLLDRGDDIFKIHMGSFFSLPALLIVRHGSVDELRDVHKVLHVQRQNKLTLHSQKLLIFHSH